MALLSDRTKAILSKYVVPGVLACSVGLNIALIVVLALALSGKYQFAKENDGSKNYTNRSASLRDGADPTAIYWGRFEPTRTARLSIPYKNFRVLIYEPSPSVTSNSINTKNDMFYYTPAAAINASSAVHSNNKFANKYQVEYSMLMWDADYVAHIRKEISERLNIPNPKLRIIPIEEVRVDVVTTDWMKEYEIDNNWRPYSMAPMYVTFRVFCTTKNDCLDLKDDIKSQTRLFAADTVMYYNLQSKSSSARRLTVNVEHISTGRLFTELKTKFTGSGDVYLSGADAKELTAEIATNLMAAEISDADFIDQQNSPKLMQLIETALEMTTESTKNFDAQKWNSVFWKDENARPDKVTYRLNDAYSKLSEESKLQIKEAYQRKDGTNTCFNVTGKYEGGKGGGGGDDDEEGEDEGGEEAQQRQRHHNDNGTAVNFHDPFHHLRNIREASYYDCGCPAIQCDCGKACGCDDVPKAPPTPLPTTTRPTTTTTTTTPTSTRPPRPTRPPTTSDESADNDAVTAGSQTTKLTKKPTVTTTEKPEKEKDQERDFSGKLEACIPKSTETKDKKNQEDFNRFFQESKNYSEFKGEKFEVKTMNLRRLNLASLVSRTNFETSSIRLSTAAVVMKTNINLIEQDNSASVASNKGETLTESAELGRDVREVFFVRANVSAVGFHSSHAIHLCKAFDAQLATAAQMRQAWIRGADWCAAGHGYGDGQSTMTSMYPSRSCFLKENEPIIETYSPDICISEAAKIRSFVLHEIPKSVRNVNDTYVNGANCYGIKPRPGEDLHYSGIRLQISDFTEGIYQQTVL